MFEIHITCSMLDMVAADYVAQALNWKTSEITGDPVLGKGAYFYLTDHKADYVEACVGVDIALALLRKEGVTPVRVKIELTVFDTKFPSAWIQLSETLGVLAGKTDFAPRL